MWMLLSVTMSVHGAHSERIGCVDGSDAYQALEPSDGRAGGLLRRVIDILCEFLVEKRDLLDVVGTLHGARR